MKETDLSICILMGTFNGSRYIAKQIRSIQRQTIPNWRLLIRDDCSADETPDIVKAFSQNDSRIRLIGNHSQKLGVVGNFARLMDDAINEKAEVVFFSDQDDLWLSDKIGVFLNCMKKMQKWFGHEVPFLVHSDLVVVDEQLNILNPSFMAYQGIAHENRCPLKILLPQNFVTGCALAVNRKMLELALPVPEGVVMHDWWLALGAAAFGRIGFVRSPTVLYRQHSENAIGAKSFWDELNPIRTKPAERWNTGSRSFLESVRQAGALAERIRCRGKNTHGEALRLANTYANCLTIGARRRISLILRLGLRRQGTVRQILFLLRLLFSKRQQLR